MDILFLHVAGEREKSEHTKSPETALVSYLRLVSKVRPVWNFKKNVHCASSEWGMWRQYGNWAIREFYSELEALSAFKSAGTWKFVRESKAFRVPLWAVESLFLGADLATSEEDFQNQHCKFTVWPWNCVKHYSLFANFLLPSISSPLRRRQITKPDESIFCFRSEGELRFASLVILHVKSTRNRKVQKSIKQ